METGKSTDQPEPHVTSERQLDGRVVKVTRTARVNFEDVYGIRPDLLRAKGIDPTKYAQEHSVGNAAFERVVAATRRSNHRRLWTRVSRADVTESRPPRRLSRYWFLNGMVRGIIVVVIGVIGFVTAIERAVARTSWGYLGYAALFLVLVLACSAFMWRGWRNRRTSR